MTYAELKPGDILFNRRLNTNPVYLVVRCDHSKNEFAWVPLAGNLAGRCFEPNLRVVGMWEEKLFLSYSAILRGSEKIRP